MSPKEPSGYDDWLIDQLTEFNKTLCAICKWHFFIRRIVGKRILSLPQALGVGSCVAKNPKHEATSEFFRLFKEITGRNYTFYEHFD